MSAGNEEGASIAEGGIPVPLSPPSGRPPAARRGSAGAPGRGAAPPPPGGHSRSASGAAARSGGHAPPGDHPDALARGGPVADGVGGLHPDLDALEQPPLLPPRPALLLPDALEGQRVLAADSLHGDLHRGIPGVAVDLDVEDGRAPPQLRVHPPGVLGEHGPRPLGVGFLAVVLSGPFGGAVHVDAVRPGFKRMPLDEARGDDGRETRPPGRLAGDLVRVLIEGPVGSGEDDAALPGEGFYLPPLAPAGGGRLGKAARGEEKEKKELGEEPEAHWHQVR